MTAAMRYKEIASLARKATVDVQSWERSRAVELEPAIEAARADVEAATEREQGAMTQARRWWRMAVDNVARLSWLDAGDEPEPAETARASHLDRHIEDVRTGYQDLTRAVQSLGWRAR